MSRGIQPEILATFETILPEHGDLEEYLQAIVLQDDGGAAQNASSSCIDLGFDPEHLDRATLLPFIESQRLYTRANPATEHSNRSRNLSWNNSLNSELDAAIALSLEEVEEEEPIDESFTHAEDEQEATPTEPSPRVLVQDDIDPDDMSFEQLGSLEEAVGTESRGLSKELLDSFPVQSLKAKSGWFSSNKNDPEGCTICLTEYEVGSKLLTLPCLHLYHTKCIKQWLKDNKTCPVCNTDISEPQV